jgi:glycerol-3-phosphate cytidylyltransferase
MTRTQVVYTGGTFDLFHAGHVSLLRACRRLAGYEGKVIVGLNSDEFVSRYKGQRPIIPFLDRREILGACCYVDQVVRNSGDENSCIVIEQIQPTIIAVGIDWAVRDYYKQMGFDQVWLDSRSIQLVYIPHVPNLSTTQIKKFIRE